jgi:hypothetical protein
MVPRALRFVGHSIESIGEKAQDPFARPNLRYLTVSRRRHVSATRRDRFLRCNKTILKKSTQC